MPVTQFQPNLKNPSLFNFERVNNVHSFTENVETTRVGGSMIQCQDALQSYKNWDSPTCIIVDGPYGLGKFPGETSKPESLPEWYAPHIAAWGSLAATNTTLWFWCTEIGWALTHPVLELMGWQYEECNVWDKGVAHIAGNCNSKTIRGMPVVSEVSVRYTKRNLLPDRDGELRTIKDWVRSEWQRSGLSMSKANEACGVLNAATRKYLTQCSLWYFPPAEAMVRMANYCNANGLSTSRPYFSLDGRNTLTEVAWGRMRSKWNHAHSVTNVWHEPAVHGRERMKDATGYVHANQKPLSIMKRQILACTDPNDVVWEPFGGMCSASVAAIKTGRRSFASEINSDYFKLASDRLFNEYQSLEIESKYVI